MDTVLTDYQATVLRPKWDGVGHTDGDKLLMTKAWYTYVVGKKAVTTTQADNAGRMRQVIEFHRRYPEAWQEMSRAVRDHRSSPMATLFLGLAIIKLVEEDKILPPPRQADLRYVAIAILHSEARGPRAQSKPKGPDQKHMEECRKALTRS